MNARRATTRRCGADAQHGHTLLEVLVALFITTMVIVALSSSLSFSMRFLQKEQEKPADLLQGRLDTLEMQLASFYDAEEACAVFEGDESSLMFSTSRSVRALHNGAPVIVRYVFAEGEGEEGSLFYGEASCDAFFQLDAELFRDAEPSLENAGEESLFHAVPASAFALAYYEDADDQGEESWKGAPGPKYVVVSSRAYENAPERVQAVAAGVLQFRMQ